jgi:hypothetical protein
MTPAEYEIINEIELYHKRFGKWPTIALMHKITKFPRPTLTHAIQRAVEGGYLEYKSPYFSGKTRYIGLA